MYLDIIKLICEIPCIDAKKGEVVEVVLQKRPEGWLQEGSREGVLYSEAEGPGNPPPIDGKKCWISLRGVFYPIGKRETKFVMG